MKERAKMADHEMLNLDEMGTLKDSMELLGEELMNGHRINPNLYVEYDVKRGLRDSAGKGVLTGLTEISDVTGYDLINGRKIPAHGRLYYQGYNVNDIVDGLKGRKFGFEETIYLLLFGRLPSDKDIRSFHVRRIHRQKNRFPAMYTTGMHGDPGSLRNRLHRQKSRCYRKKPCSWKTGSHDAG